MSQIRHKRGLVALDVPALLIGVGILAKGWGKMAHFEHHPLMVSLLFLLGGAVVIGSVLTLWLEKRLESAHGLLHAVEGVAIVLSAVVLMADGRLRIPLVMLFAGLAYLASGIFQCLPPSRRERYAGAMQTSFGVAFMAAGLVLAVSTAFHDSDTWAFGTAALIAATGVAFLLLPIGFVRRKPGIKKTEPISDNTAPTT